MNKYYFLNYWIYDWYSRRDPQPVIYAVIVPAICVFLNILCIAFACSALFHFSVVVGPVTYFAGIIFLIIVNYFLLYYHQRYRRLFERFRRQEEVTHRYKKSIVAYLAGTTGLLLLAWIIS